MLGSEASVSIDPIGSEEALSGRSSQVGEQFVYGGVEFEILTDFGWALPADFSRCIGEASAGPRVGQVRCAVSAGLARRGQKRRPVRWTWTSQSTAAVSTQGMRAQLLRLAPRRYVATAYTAPDEQGAGAVLTALAAATAAKEGGLVLHAAGVVVDGQAVLMVGPSGTGKTTACTLTDGAVRFSRDRVAIAPVGGTWWAWQLAGGSPDETPLADFAGPEGLPLGAVLRVRRAERDVSVRRLGKHQALGVVRESSLSGAASILEEQAMLECIDALADRVVVGELHTRLGVSLHGLLSEWLGEGSP